MPINQFCYSLNSLLVIVHLHDSASVTLEAGINCLSNFVRIWKTVYTNYKVILRWIQWKMTMGVIMSYYGWNGKDDSYAARRLLSELIGLRHDDIDIDLIIHLNDHTANII